MVEIVNYRRLRREEGLLAAVYALVLGAILVYAFVTYKYAINIRQRATMNSIVVSVLNSSINASPGDIVTYNPASPGQDVFRAACSTLKSLMFDRESRIGCIPGDLQQPTQQHVANNQWVADYSAAQLGGIFVSDDGAFRCNDIQIRYQGIMPGQPGQGPLPQELCVTLDCSGYQTISLSSIDLVRAEGCIQGDRPIAYVSYDTSDAAAKFYVDCPGGNLAGCKMTHPPSNVVLGDSQYLPVSASSVPASMSFYTAPSAAGGAGWNTNQLWQYMIDSQIPGVGPQLNTVTGLPPPRQSANTPGLNIPFRFNEFDQLESVQLQAWGIPSVDTSTPNNKADWLNPDSISARVIDSLPNRSTAKNPDLGYSSYPGPDPMNLIYGAPRFGIDSPSIMEDWFNVVYSDPLAATPKALGEPRTQTRGGDLTGNFLRNSCYGALVNSSKHAVEQTLYSLAANNVQTALLSFSNFLIPKMPVLPLPLYSQLNLRADTAPLLGPSPGNIPLGPYAGIDFIDQQFSDPADPNKITWNNALLLNHSMATCARDASLTDGTSATPWAAYPDFNNPNAARSYWPQPYYPMAPYVVGTSAGTCAGNVMLPGNLPPYYDPTYHMALDKEQCCDPSNPFSSALCVSSAWTFTNAATSPFTCKWATTGPNAICNNGHAANQPPQNPYEQQALEQNDIASSWRWCPDLTSGANPALTLPVAVQSEMTGNFAWTGLPVEKGLSVPGANIFSARTFPTSSYGPERAASAALLTMYRALTDQNLVAPWRLKAGVLFLNGAPDLSVWDMELNPGGTQSYFFGSTPLEVAKFQTGTADCGGTATAVSNATQEFVTLAHLLVSSGIKLYIIYIPPPHALLNSVDPIAVVKSGLAGPNKSAIFSSNPMTPPAPPDLQPSSYWCNQSAPALNGISFLEYRKQDTETFAAFENRVLQQLSTTMMFDLLRFRLTK